MAANEAAHASDEDAAATAEARVAAANHLVAELHLRRRDGIATGLTRVSSARSRTSAPEYRGIGPSVHLR